MSNYHEPAEELSAQARDFSRALNSLKEEIEAVDWYHQRVTLSENEELAQIMAHNRDEEIEHACMTIEWLRRNMPGWDEELRTYLFKDGNITELEEGGEGSSEGGSRSNSLGIGKIKK
ncbi:ferritin-like domain-containing protein [Marinilabiliaceae bacterium ANBcel2]|nr:ferritin-like domain-containing protein [Marinilabiliaceae bacterium ANBcel2]